jgi:hypothetical protein
LPLEGFTDFVAEVFDADVVAVDFFDEKPWRLRAICSAVRT